MENITLCLLGDDRERNYAVTYEGTADITNFDGECLGDRPVALIRNQESEALILHHPEHGWCSAGNASCRDFQPALDQARLEAAQ